jgi:hypothetical protein
MKKPPSPTNPQVIGDDIRESYEKWAQLEILRIMARYKIAEGIATSAVAMTVLGASVHVLRVMGKKTTEAIIAMIKGQEPS